MSKKKMYYNMRVKTLQRNKADLMCRLETEKAALQSNTKKRIQKLYSAVKDVCIYLLCTNNVNFFSSTSHTQYLSCNNINNIKNNLITSRGLFTFGDQQHICMYVCMYVYIYISFNKINCIKIK